MRHAVALGAAHVAVAFGLACAAPAALLLLAPLLLGVPHVVSDVRYLLVRTDLAHRATLAIVAPLAALTLLRFAALAGAPVSPALDVLLGAASIAGGVAAAPAGRGLRAVCLGGVAALGVVAAWRAESFTVAFAHAHNAVALVVLVLWSGWRGASVGALALVAAVALALVAPEGRTSFGGLATEELARALAPGCSPEVGRRVVLVYAFAQAVHYSVWLHLLPRERRDGRTLAGELGAPALAVVVVLVAAVPLVGAFAPVATRAGYLSLAVFHGWLELAVLAHLAARWRA